MAKRSAGRPPHEPTKQTRKFVVSMVAAGIEQLEIARVLGITKPTLHKHYRAELDTGQALAVTEVAQSLFNMATGKAGPPNVTAAIFYLKARAGWSDQADSQKLGKKEREEQEAKEAAKTGPFQRRQPPNLKAVDK